MQQAYAAIAAHLGVVNQDAIDNMSIVFFNNVMKALGKRLNYQAVTNLFGNSFCKDAGKYVEEANPLYKKPKMDSGFLSILTSAPTIKNAASKEEVQQMASQALGSDISWAQGLFG